MDPLHRLLAYQPELGITLPPGTPPATLTQESPEADMEMAWGAELLEASAAVAAGREGPGVAAGLAPFLAGLVAHAGPAGRAALRQPLGRALMAALLRVAGRLLPFHSRPAQQRAAAIFGLELEGLSPEDKEFALARQFVRLAREVVAAALGSGPAPGRAQAEAKVQAALAQAARRHAPGLLQRARRV